MEDLATQRGWESAPKELNATSGAQFVALSLVKPIFAGAEVLLSRQAFIGTDFVTS